MLTTDHEQFNNAPVNCMPHYPPPAPYHGEPGGIDGIGRPKGGAFDRSVYVGGNFLVFYDSHVGHGHSNLCQIPYYTPVLYWVPGRGFDLEYCFHPGDIEIWNVKSPSMPPHGAGGGYWGIPLTGA